MEPDTTHFRTCPLCEATCGLALTVRNGVVVNIRGDRDNAFSKGFICPKGSVLHKLHDDPDRLRAPLVRRGDDPDLATWDTVSWEEAFAAVAEGIQSVIDRHGRHSVGAYFGNPSIHSLGTVMYNRVLIQAMASPQMYSASTVDQMPKHVSSGLMFGNPLLIAVPDIDRTDHLLILGANPYESNGSLATAPDWPGRIQAIRDRGGKVVVVDPRRTKTAMNADEWHSIRPGNDAFLLCAMLHVLFAEDLIAKERIFELTSGAQDIADAVAPFSPAAVADHVGINAETITSMAREFAMARTAVVYGRIGTHTVGFGTLAAWAVDALNLLTGNLDAPGGAMFPLAPHENGKGKGRGRGFRIGRRHSRVRGYPEVRSEYPVAGLAEEISTPGEGQIRAMVTVGGNPVLSTPHSARLDSSLRELEFMVSVDPYLNETTRHANVILPPPTPLERSEYQMAFIGLAVRNFAQWAPPMFDSSCLQEHEILGRLALIFTGPDAGNDPTVIDAMVLDGALQSAIDTVDSPVADRSIDELRAIVQTDSTRTAIDHLLDVMIRTGWRGDWFGVVPDGLSLNVFKNTPHGIDLGPLESRLPSALRTESGTIELAPQLIIEEIERLADGLSATIDPHALVLIGRRHLQSNNSWMHNINALVKGKVRCTLQVNPLDATRLLLTDGSQAIVTSRVGSLTAPIEITDEVPVGVVSLPHGWGHDLVGTQSKVAARRPGVNANLLTDPELLDPLSGNAVLNGFAVTVSSA
ncbi:MAG: molybdopterin-dependent oxidoreductase [Acidimicrobiales bacterium]